MKKIVLLSLLLQGILCQAIGSYVIGEDTVCGGTTETYTILAIPVPFHHYHWWVQGGTFEDGKTGIDIYDVDNKDVDVTWDPDQRSVNARLGCTIYFTENNSMHNVINKISRRDFLLPLVASGVVSGINYYILYKFANFKVSVF